MENWYIFFLKYLVMFTDEKAGPGAFLKVINYQYNFIKIFRLIQIISTPFVDVGSVCLPRNLFISNMFSYL